MSPALHPDRRSGSGLCSVCGRVLHPLHWARCHVVAIGAAAGGGGGRPPRGHRDDFSSPDCRRRPGANSAGSDGSVTVADAVGGHAAGGCCVFGVAGVCCANASGRGSPHFEPQPMLQQSAGRPIRQT